MAAGKRDELITVERATETTDEYGESIKGWSTLGQEWARVFYGTGNERRIAAAEQGEQSATFQVLYNAVTASMSIKDRIASGGSYWDIRGISPDTPKRGKIEFTAVRTL